MSTLRTSPIVIALATLLGVFAYGHSQAADTRSRAVLAFQRDLVSTLAGSTDAEPLFGAALLARALPEATDAKGFHALIERADKAAPTRPAINWLRLADCDADAMNCPNPVALKALQSEAPDNAAVWLMTLGTAARNGSRTQMRMALALASRASGYEDYAGRSLRALAEAVDTSPAPSAISASGLSSLGARAVLVYALGASQPRPAFQIAAQQCRDDSPRVRAECLRLGFVLESASSPRARSLGLHLLETLSDRPRIRADARARRLDLVWQVQQFARLTARAHSDDTVARRLLELARTGKPEMALMLDALYSFDIPTQPPAGWRPGAGANGD